jgi:hypothetical protein
MLKDQLKKPFMHLTCQLLSDREKNLDDEAVTTRTVRFSSSTPPHSRGCAARRDIPKAVRSTFPGSALHNLAESRAVWRGMMVGIRGVRRESGHYDTYRRIKIWCSKIVKGSLDLSSYRYSMFGVPPPRQH